MTGRAMVFSAVLIASSGFALFNARSPSSQAAPSYIGSEACKSCHETQWEEFQSNAHHRAEMDGQVVADHVGCESCHGPGSLHAEAGGDPKEPGFASIRNFATMEPADASATCTGCHAGGEQFYWEHSNHAKNDVSCVECHSIHSSKSGASAPMLTAVNTNELCMSCHNEKRAQLARTAHMPLREGSMDCADCHNPHGSMGQNQLRAASTNELCISCHADKRGPMLWEHAPVREDCLNCHQPHGSNSDKVLAGKRPFLCQRCHIGTRHPSTLYDADDLASNRLFNRSCTNCHTQIHGSNHPAGKFLLR